MFDNDTVRQCLTLAMMLKMCRAHDIIDSTEYSDERFTVSKEDEVRRKKCDNSARSKAFASFIKPHSNDNALFSRIGVNLIGS